MTPEEVKQENLRKALHHQRELLELCQDPVIANAIANNFWDTDDSGSHHYCAEEIADECTGSPIEVMCAMSLPGFTITATPPADPENDDENTYTFGE